MKKIIFSFFSLLMTINLAFAGGLVENTNQSAAWARMLVRDASTSIDAVYFNPAGLTKLSDGLHISISNQSIFQNRMLTNSYPALNNGEYEGTVSAPLFPNFYAAYKTGKLAFSLGFMPIGGGGGAAYDAGVPMIEIPVAELATAMGVYGVTGYNLNTSFEGSSVYFGIQGGVTYAINDMISVFAGARYVWAKNTYTGEMTDVNFETGAGDVAASTFMNDLASQALLGATAATAAVTNMQPLIDGGAGSLTFAEAEGGGVIDAATRLQLEGGLLAFGFTQQQIDAMDLATAQGSYQATATLLGTQAAEAAGAAVIFGGQEADVTQTGNGVTPVFGLNLALMEDKLNIGVKYALKTELELTNSTPAGKGFTMGFTPTGDPVEMFPDGDVTDADIPAMLSVGVNYKLSDAFSAQVGYHTYFDKNTGWAEEDEDLIDNNYMEIGLGLEYNISEQFLVSAGFLRAQTGVNQVLYNDDISYSLSSNTVGLGGAYKLNDMMTLQFGGYTTMYESPTLEYMGGPITQKYEKSNIAFAVGLDFTLGGE